jgi:2-aminoadipate transaminase
MSVRSARSSRSYHGQEFDIDTVYARSVSAGAAFVPGKYFFTNPQRGLETMRLNFTTAEPEALSRAIAIISAAIEEES